MDSTEVAEIKRYVSVLIEGLESKLHSVAEDLSAASEKLERLDAKVEGLGTRIGRVEVRLDSIERQLESVEQRLDSIEERFEALDKRVATEAEETRAMIRLSYAELDRRLLTLETGLAQLRDRVDRLEKGN